MPHQVLAPVSLLCVLACLPAQTATVPYTTTGGGNVGRDGLFNQGTVDVRHQMIYAGSRLTYLGGPVQIHRLRWYSRTNPGAGGTIAQATIKLGHSALPYSAPSTVFALNQGPDLTTVHSGPLPIQPVVGWPSGPGPVLVDVPLQTPFVLLPTMGDLLVEIEWAAGGYTGGNVSQLDYVEAPGTAATHLWRNGTPNATYASNWVPQGAPRMDFDYTPAQGYAYVRPYGVGCYERQASFYEAFVGGFDLSGSAATTRCLRCVPNTGGGYDVADGADRWFTPTGPAIGSGGVFPLGFTFPYPGGSTTSVEVHHKGYVWLGAHGADQPQPSIASLLADGPRIAVYWANLALSAGFPVPGAFGTVHFDIDPTTGHAVCTWLQLPFPAISGPFVQSTFQLVLEPGGAFELRYRDCPGQLATQLVGWSHGAAGIDPGQRDLSAAVPFATLADSRALELGTSTRPILGATVTFATRQVPAGALFGAVFLSFAAHDPGLPLAGIGMAGCQQYLPLDALLVWLPSGPVAQTMLPLSPDPVWRGVDLFAQSSVLVPGVNALGVLSSNGLRLSLDLQ